MSFQSIGFLLLFMMNLNSATGLSELILKNRENRTYYRILSSPINARTYVLANVLVNIIVMIAQIIVALFFMRVVFNLDPGISMGEMLLILTLLRLYPSVCRW